MLLTSEKIQIPKIAKSLPSDRLVRELRDANAERAYQAFDEYIHHWVEILKTYGHQEMLNDFLVQFEEAFELWKDYLDRVGTIPEYDGAILDVLRLGMWHFAYANDPNGLRSPFGPYLAGLGEFFEGQPIGILHALEQQFNHWNRNNLVKAQQLANELYQQFLRFVEMNHLSELKPDYEYPPLIQLYMGGAVTFLSSFPVPTIIAMDERKSHQLSGFSALPHEFGHDVSGTFHSRVLVEEIVETVRELHLPHGELWQLWMEECFADAIGVMTIKEGEIFSLANLFSNFYTNIIFGDESASGHDEHPVRHIRVLVALEVGRILGIDGTLIDQTTAEWMAFGNRINTAVPADQIYDQVTHSFYPMAEFIEGVEPVANALVNKACSHLNGYKIRDIFADFHSDIAEELRTSITEKRWLED